jgi:MFS family permease
MFKTVAQNKRLLMWTIFLMCMVQMPHLALSSGIDVIHRQVFTDKSLATIQTVIAIQNLLRMFTGILSAILISTQVASKKNLTVTGISMIAVTGIIATIFHTQFWELVMFSVLIGLGIGLFITGSQSMILDNFDEKERQLISGFQFSFINLGGILMSVVGGLLITIIWYGGYLMLLLMIPVAILAVIVLPRDQVHRGEKQPGKGNRRGTHLPRVVYYYSLTLFIFMLIFSVTASNLSTHLKTNNLGNAGTAGAVIATMMAGGVLAGLIYDKLASRLRDMMIPVSFFLVFAGFTMLNIFHGNLMMIFFAVFISGMSLSFCLPQCIVSSSNYIDPTNSPLASTQLASVAPGLGGFLSPVLFTNLTLALGGESTAFRFQFVGIVSLVLGVAYIFIIYRSGKTSQTSSAGKSLCNR